MVWKVQIQFGGENLCMFVHLFKKNFCRVEIFLRSNFAKDNGK